MDARTFDWELSQRCYNFLLGVLLPIPLLFSLSWIAFLLPFSIVQLVMLVFAFTIFISSAALAAHCIYPEMGKQTWVRYSVAAGIYFWTPVAFFWATITFLFALIASLLVVVVIKVGAKAVAPLYVKDSRFSLKQVFWLITLCALIVAALSPWLRSVENVTWLLYAAHGFIVLATPVLAAVAFSAVNLEMQDLVRERSGIRELD